MNALALRCPYCHTGFNPEDGITHCSQCFAIHHAVCWEENHHCSVFACNGNACYSRPLPRTIEIAPPILLLLMFFFPHAMIPFATLIAPAILCVLCTLVHMLESMVQGTWKDRYTLWYESIIALVLNLSAVSTPVFFFLLHS